MATAPAAFGYWLMAMSTAYAAKAQQQAGRYQAGMAKQNAEVANLAAADAIRRGQVEEGAARRRAARVAGAQRAAFGASGVELGSGTPATVLEDTRMLSELDALTIGANARREAWGLQARATDFLGQSALARFQGRTSAVGTLLEGGAEMYGGYYRSKQAQGVG